MVDHVVASSEKVCSIDWGVALDAVHWEHTKAYCACNRVDACSVMEIKYTLRVGRERNIVVLSTGYVSKALVDETVQRFWKSSKGDPFAGRAGYVQDIFHRVFRRVESGDSRRDIGFFLSWVY